MKSKRISALKKDFDELKGKQSVADEKNGKIQTSYDEIKEKLRESIVREWTEEEGKVAWTEYQVYSKQKCGCFFTGDKKRQKNCICKPEATRIL